MGRVNLESTAASFVILATNALGGIVLARSLGPAGRGEFASLVVWAALATAIATLGSVGAVTYFVAQSETAGEYALQRVARAYPLMALIGLILFVAFAAAGAAGLYAASLAMAASVPIRVLFQQIQAYLLGRGRFRAFNVNRVVAGVGGSIIAVALAVSGTLTVSTAALAYLGAIVLALVSAVAEAASDRARIGATVQTDGDHGSVPFWNYSARNFAASIGTQGNQQVDLFALSLIAMPSAVGIYAVAAGFAAPIAVVGSSIALVVLPRIAGAGIDSERAVMIRRSLVLSALGGGAAAVGVVVFGDRLVPLLFGDAFLQAVPVTRVLAFGVWAFGLSMVAGAALKGLGRPGIVAVSQFIGLTLTLGLIVGVSGGDLVRTAYATTFGFGVALAVDLLALFLWRRQRSAVP